MWGGKQDLQSPLVDSPTRRLGGVGGIPRYNSPLGPRYSPLVRARSESSPLITRLVLPETRQAVEQRVGVGVEVPSVPEEGISRHGAALATNLQTGFNLVNNYVGMVLLSQAFCCARSGWLALAALAVLTVFGAFTGSLIIDAYNIIVAEGEAVPSYAQIGTRCMGHFGKWLVLVSSVLETFAAILCMNIIIWSNAALVVPDVPLPYVIAVCCVLSFPTNYLRDFSLLSFLSAFGLGCIGLIMAVVGYDVLSAASERQLGPGLEPVGMPGTDGPAAGAHSLSAERVLADWSGLPMSASIMLAGLTGHVGLPPMYAEMKTPSAFKPTLYSSFFVMFLMYAFVGAGGYFLYGSAASVLITQDMADAAASPVDSFLVSLVLGGITFKLFCSVPMCVVVLVDIVENLYEEKHGVVLSEAAADRARLAMWVTSTACSVATYSSLQYVTALIGINSMLISVLLPIAFYVMLKRHTMSLPVQLAYALIVLVSLAITAVISTIDIEEFLDSLSSLGGDGDDR